MIEKFISVCHKERIVCDECSTPHREGYHVATNMRVTKDLCFNCYEVAIESQKLKDEEDIRSLL